MSRFQKTRLHVVSAVAVLLVLYALAGLAYAAWVHSDESVVAWGVIAVVALLVAVANQWRVNRKRRLAP